MGPAPMATPTSSFSVQPPAKRQRTESPSFSSVSMAPPITSGPQSPSLALHPGQVQPGLVMPQQVGTPSAATSMPPPNAPASRPQESGDFNDVLAATGVNEREEELQSLFVVQQPRSTDEQYQADRQRAEFLSNHMNDPFLENRVLLEKLSKISQKYGIKSFAARDPSGRIVTTGPTADYASLCSLSTREHVVSLVTRSIALAKARRRPPNIVTGEWATAVKNGKLSVRENAKIPADAIGTDSIDYDGSRNHAYFSPEGNPLAPPPLGSSYVAELPQSEVIVALRDLKRKHWQSDQARIAKKQKREQGANAASPAGEAIGGDAPSPAADSLTAPTPPPTKKKTKELQKAATQEANNHIAHQSANATAALMLGGGAKKKKYSWMTPKYIAPGGPTGMGMQGMGPGPGTVLPGTPGTPNLPNGLQTVRVAGPMDVGRRWGTFREDNSRGVQLRDWVKALEDDGRVGYKGKQKAYLKFKKEN